MAKYLILWEDDTSKYPIDPKERVALIGENIELTKKAMDAKQITDWGLFASGGAGYAIGNGEATDMLKGTMQFSPYIKFKSMPVLSLDEVTEVMKSMM